MTKSNLLIIARVKRSFFILKLWGTPNYYKGIDRPNAWQWIYQWRISLSTAIKIGKIIHS